MKNTTNNINNAYPQYRRQDNRISRSTDRQTEYVIYFPSLGVQFLGKFGLFIIYNIARQAKAAAHCT